MRYRKIILRNGVRLIMITDLSTNAVTISAFLRAGFRFDPIEKPGLAHFAEHMVFNGTKSFPTSRSVAQAVEKYGGWHTAFTWVEHQEHTVHLPKDYFKNGLELLLETILNSRIDKSEVEKEKGVISEEILRNKSDPSRAIWDYVWFPLFFQGTNLARLYSGTAKNILTITDLDVKSFINKFFKSKDTILFVAGDLQENYIQEAVLKYSQGVDNTKNKENQIVPKIRKQILVYQDDSYYQSSLVIGIKTVPFNSNLKYIFDILREMLGGYFGASLIQKLRDEGGLIYTWNTFHDNLSDTGYLVLNFSVAHQNVSRVVSIILQEFKKFSNGGFTKEEVEMAKNHLIGSIFSNIEKGEDYIEWFGMQELLNPKRVLNIKDKINLYKNITIEEIKETATKYFTNRNIFIGVIGKAKEASLLKFI